MAPSANGNAAASLKQVMPQCAPLSTPTFPALRGLNITSRFGDDCMYTTKGVYTHQ